MSDKNPGKLWYYHIDHAREKIDELTKENERLKLHIEEGRQWRRQLIKREDEITRLTERLELYEKVVEAADDVVHNCDEMLKEMGRLTERLERYEKVVEAARVVNEWYETEQLTNALDAVKDGERWNDGTKSKL